MHEQESYGFTMIYFFVGVHISNYLAPLNPDSRPDYTFLNLSKKKMLH